jgi:nitroreductase
MQGFDYNEAREVLNIPEGYNVECMVAIGERASPEVLPEDMRENEIPNQRKDIEDIVMNRGF